MTRERAADQLITVLCRLGVPVDAARRAEAYLDGVLGQSEEVKDRAIERVAHECVAAALGERVPS